MENVPCNLCGSEKQRVVYRMPDTLYFRDEWFNVVECRQCGLGFVSPRPTYEEIFRHYPTVFYEGFEREEQHHERRYRIEADFIHRFVQPGTGKMLLDVGCANGAFPRYMHSQGWEVEGVEVSPNAQPITDFKVYTQDFAQIPLNEPRYDAVTAWAVLEHVHNPMSYFEKASQVLKPGGALIFLVTNFSSLSSRTLFREDVPRHLYFYTEKTVRNYLDRCGFDLVRSEYSDQIYAMRPVGWLRYHLRRLVGRRPLKYEEVPPNRPEFLERHKLPNTLKSNLRYLVSHPLDALDRVLLPLYEKVQMRNKTYGIVTYCAIKR